MAECVARESPLFSFAGTSEAALRAAQAQLLQERQNAAQEEAALTARNAAALQQLSLQHEQKLQQIAAEQESCRKRGELLRRQGTKTRLPVHSRGTIVLFVCLTLPI